jgi:hypothetical protein
MKRAAWASAVVLVLVLQGAMWNPPQREPEGQESAEPPPAPLRAIMRVQRGVLSFSAGEHEASARLEFPIDPARSVVTLSEAIAPAGRNNGNPRCGAVVFELNESRLVVWTDEQHTRRIVGFQIVEHP